MASRLYFTLIFCLGGGLWIGATVSLQQQLFHNSKDYNRAASIPEKNVKSDKVSEEVDN